MEEQKEKKQGHKGKGQKYKSLLVWDILSVAERQTAFLPCLRAIWAGRCGTHA